MTTPVTHEAARKAVVRYVDGGVAQGCLFDYIAQAELVEKERDELRAKLDFLVICDECRKPIDQATDACRCFDGPWSTAEHVPGTFHQRCCEPARVKFATARDNARLAAVVREHGSSVVYALEIASAHLAAVPTQGKIVQAMRDAAKALAEALKP